MNYSAFLGAIVLLGLIACSVGSKNNIMVQTPFGQLQGKEAKAPNSQNYFSFTGIPYAKPPLGPLRFAKPEPHPPLEDVFDATKDAVFCPNPIAMYEMLNLTLPASDEDCLLLNVLVKNLPGGTEEGASSYTSTETNSNKATAATAASGKKKVLLWIHGGGFIAGGATEFPAGTFVTTQDVVLVAINYRLGILGFLSTGDKAAPGNYGLWDQLLAIQWVRENIAAFGGDPNDITITGESAGGASVAMLSITPTAKDLFTKVYPMSGAATSVFAIARNPLSTAIDVARAAGCTGEAGNEVDDVDMSLDETQKLTNCLREQPWEELVKYTQFSLEKAQFVPVVDGDFFPLHPATLLKDDTYLETIGFFDRTYLIGMDNNERAIMEGNFLAFQNYIMASDKATEEEKAALLAGYISRSQDFYISSRIGMYPPPQSTLEKVKDWYGRRINGETVSDISTDLNFLIPTYDLLNTIARSRQTNAYAFYFNHYPSFMKGKYRGVVHAVDLLYWMDIKLARLETFLNVGMQGEFDEEELQLGVIVSDMIGQFVKTGNPWNGLQEELPGGWPAFSLQGNHYLDLNPRPVIRRHLLQEKRDFWLNTVPEWAVRDSASASP